MKIWKRTTDINKINKNMKNTMTAHLGIIITEISKDTLEGTMPVTSASLTFGNKIFTSLAFNKMLSSFEATPITFILNLLAYLSMLASSGVFPEYENTIRISFFSI